MGYGWYVFPHLRGPEREQHSTGVNIGTSGPAMRGGGRVENVFGLPLRTDIREFMVVVALPVHPSPLFYVNGGSPGSRQLRFRPFAPFCSKVSRERRQAVTQQVAREEQQKRSTGLAQRSPGPDNDRVGECD